MLYEFKHKTIGIGITSGTKVHLDLKIIQEKTQHNFFLSTKHAALFKDFSTMAMRLAIK